MLQPEPTITVGLRFKRTDIPTLTMLRDVARADGKGDLGAFDRALTAAVNDEPLIVRCLHPDEAHRLAAAYVRCGVTHPAIETLIA